MIGPPHKGGFLLHTVASSIVQQGTGAAALSEGVFMLHRCGAITALPHSLFIHAA